MSSDEDPPKIDFSADFDIFAQALLHARQSTILSWEWLAAGLALSGLYLLAVVQHRSDIRVIDVVFLILGMGTGIYLFTYERTNSQNYLKLAEALGADHGSKTVG